jgi:sialate O-acetylesterase
MSDLWILAGQSNMEGPGRLVDVEKPASNIRSFAHGDYWKVAEEPLHWILEAVDEAHHCEMTGADLEAARQRERRDRVNGTGPGLTFAKFISHRTGIDIDLLPAAHGGTSMSQWSPEFKSQGGKYLYGALLRRTKAALETGGDIRLRGVLWYQGESDCDAQSAPHYQERTINLINNLRADLDFPELPFYLVQLGCWNGEAEHGDETSKIWNAIREAQRLIPTIVPHTATIPAIDLALNDGIHIATPGVKRLGRRFANVALNEVYGQKAPIGPRLKSVTLADNTIRVSFENVSRTLVTPDSAGRVHGFSIEPKFGKPKPFPIYRSEIAQDNPSHVLLHVDQPIGPGGKLYYGEGVFPICQLTDSNDMAVPAFGPVEIVNR